MKKYKAPKKYVVVMRGHVHTGCMSPVTTDQALKDKRKEWDSKDV